MCSWKRKNLYRLPHVIEPSSVITQRIWLTWGMGKMEDMLHNKNRGSVGLTLVLHILFQAKKDWEDKGDLRRSARDWAGELISGQSIAGRILVRFFPCSEIIISTKGSISCKSKSCLSRLESPSSFRWRP